MKTLILIASLFSVFALQGVQTTFAEGKKIKCANCEKKPQGCDCKDCDCPKK